MKINLLLSYGAFTPNASGILQRDEITYESEYYRVSVVCKSQKENSLFGETSAAKCVVLLLFYCIPTELLLHFGSVSPGGMLFGKVTLVLLGFFCCFF